MWQWVLEILNVAVECSTMKWLIIYYNIIISWIHPRRGRVDFGKPRMLRLLVGILHFDPFGSNVSRHQVGCTFHNLISCVLPLFSCSCVHNLDQFQISERLLHCIIVNHTMICMIYKKTFEVCVSNLPIHKVSHIFCVHCLRIPRSYISVRTYTQGDPPDSSSPKTTQKSILISKLGIWRIQKLSWNGLPNKTLFLKSYKLHCITYSL